MKFIWKRVFLFVILGAIAFFLETPIHELGHVIFTRVLGGQVIEVSYLYPGSITWEGLQGNEENVALLGGIIFSLSLGTILLVLLPKLKTPVQVRFFIFCLITFLLAFDLTYLIITIFYKSIGMNIFDTRDLVHNGFPAQLISLTGILLTLLILFPFKYLEQLVFIFKDTVNYLTKNFEIEIKTKLEE